MGIKVPDETNNVSINNTGHLQFDGSGTSFDDMNADALSVQVQGVGVSKIAAESVVRYTTLADLNDYGYANYQFSHSRKNGADVYPHIHYWQAENTHPNFLIQYRWQLNGQQKRTTWNNYPLNLEAYDYSGTIVQIAYNAIGVTPPIGDNISSILQLHLIRDNDNDSGAFSGTDPYSADVDVVFIDIHYEKDSIGSDLQYQK